ncbi:MAG TPA: HutD family protein, partial [Bacteroidales bacterium]|nr:HutD family protein [Bacteroidales bacterium]
DFLFRISTATVETEESVFTKLPGIQRKLMILDGEIKIEHEGYHSKIIKKFEQDEFNGDWNTKSYGKATDFNLMTREMASGEIEAYTVSDFKKLKINEDVDFWGIYLYSGKANIKISNKGFMLNTGDFCSVLPEKEHLEISIEPIVKSEFIITNVRFM